MPAVHDPYANFADIYDSYCCSDDIRAFYSEFRSHLLDAIRQYSVPVRVLADLACGTGNSPIPWTKQKGWTVIPAIVSAWRKRKIQAVHRMQSNRAGQKF